MISLQRLDQAAASRNKRRQYDVLLTVAAPHERIVFIVTTLLILAFLAWALLGRIEHGVMMDGVLVKPESRYDVVSAGPTHAVLRVVPGIARRIRPGMQATVDVAIPGSGTQILQGVVASVTAGPLPKWLATMEPETEDALHRIDIALHQEPGRPVSNGAACRVRIAFGAESPVALLTTDYLKI